MSFIQQLNVTSAHAAALAWAVVWQSTLLAILIAGIAWFLKQASPAARYWLWQILILKILVMPLFVVAAPWPDWGVRRPAPASIGPTRAISLEAPPLEPTTLPRAPTPHSAAPIDLPDPPKRSTEISWPTWLLIAWAAIVLGQCVRIVLQWTRLQRLLRSGGSAGVRLNAAVQEAANELNVAGRIRTVVTQTSTSPFVCGIQQPTLVMPTETFSSLSQAQLRSVLLHELAHVKRKDLLLGWIPAICRLIWFFHPLVHYAAYRIKLESELACDQLAMLHSSCNPGDYADTLIHVVSSPHGTAVFPSA